MTLKQLTKATVVLLLLGIITLQLIKRNKLIKNEALIQIEKNKSNTPYIELLEKIPVYKDSIFSIYISKINGVNEIIYLKKDSLTERQKNSKFFLHIYPVNKEKLGQNKLGNLAYDFKSNFKAFKFQENNYYVAHEILPNYLINKINTGQYGYKKDGSISWRVENLLTRKDILRVIKTNKERIKIFNKESSN